MNEQDKMLAERCERLAAATKAAGDWAADNPDVVRGELEGLQRELRRAGRLFRTCGAAARRKMCVGVFGPSQAGKSYLISALARDARGDLLADFGGETHDFISEINPEGGKESTGLVTRFTTTLPEGQPQGFPVLIRLLSETDLVKILANTYYADCEHRETPESAPIIAVLDRLEPRAGSANDVVGLDEFEELREYLEKDFQAKPRVQELERSFWTRALHLGPRLGLEERITLYSLIWNETPAFTSLLRLLLTALAGLGHAREACAPLDALIPRDGSIIDVAMLQGLGSETEGTPLRLVTRDNRQATLPRAVVTALTAELTIAMRQEPDPLFAHTDLLDFPGYRSRYKIEDLNRELGKPEMLKELFLRGKVAYLFQRYCAERELTGMLLCIGPSNQEVQDLPGVINDWVCSTHGESPQQRKGKKPSLFFVLTKFDMEFEQKKGAPSVESRWDTRLHVSMLDFFGKQHDWPRLWDGERGFSNLFLLRNPNFRFDAILNYNAEGREVGIRPDQQSYVTALENAFMQSALVAEHFANPREAWDGAMLLNDGGIGLIRTRLRPLCDPQIKTSQIVTALDERLQRLVTRLKPFWKSGDREEERALKERFAQDIARTFAVMAQNQVFGDFLWRITVSDHDLYSLYFEAERRMQQAIAEGEASTTITATPSVKADDILAGLFDTPAPGAPASDVDKSLAPPKDRAQHFAELIESHWLAGLHALAENPALQRHYGISDKDFAAFVSELALGAARLGLRADMEKSLRTVGGYANTSRERLIWKQASLAASMINAYVSWLGFNPRSKNAAERSVHINGQRFVLFEPLPPVGAYPQLGKAADVLEKQWYRDWVCAIMALIRANVDFDGEQTVNPEENRRLGEIIKALGQSF